MHGVSGKLRWHPHRALAVFAPLTLSEAHSLTLSQAHSLTLSECTRRRALCAPPFPARQGIALSEKQRHQFGHLSVCSKGLGPRGGTSLEARNSADRSHGPSPFQKASFLHWPPSLLSSNEYLPCLPKQGTVARARSPHLFFLALGHIQGYRAGRGAGQMMESHIGPVCLPQQVSVEEYESRSGASRSILKLLHDDQAVALGPCAPRQVPMQ